MRQRGRLDNFGIRRVERLDGNVGYLDLRRMPVPGQRGPAITAAMELVAGTYALIIDLRHNGGGSPEGVVFWCSYLLGEKPPVHLNDIFPADTGETRQFWALPYVPGTRYTDRPVYVLTSGQTFSGGEDLCYTLQALGRAEVIGETTGGGAHPTRPFPISPAVHIGIPFARSINPVTGTNWQGTGVVPDVAVPEEQAYDVAYARALRHVLERTTCRRRSRTRPATRWPSWRRPGSDLLAVGVDRAAGRDRAGPAAGVDLGPEDRARHPAATVSTRSLAQPGSGSSASAPCRCTLARGGHAGRLADLDELGAARLGQAEPLERAEQHRQLVDAQLRMPVELVLARRAAAGLQVDDHRPALRRRTPAGRPGR